jgi:hypothetical protein
VDDFAKSALRVGAVFASSPSFRPEVLEAAEQAAAAPLAPLSPMMPMTSEMTPEMPAALAAPVPMTEMAPAQMAPAPDADAAMTPPMFPPSSSSPESVVEPSNLVVASDVMHDSSAYGIAGLDDGRPALESDPFAMPPGMFASRGRLAAIAGACAGVLALVAVSAVVLGGGARSHIKAAATTQAVQQPAAAPAPAAVAPETVELDTPAPPPAAPSASEASTTESKPSTPTDPKKRFGKLTIKADAKHKNVWFDGKRMLGSGQRSFLVFCGMHTIAVTDKADTKDVEVPCNGELTVAK